MKRVSSFSWWLSVPFAGLALVPALAACSASASPDSTAKNASTSASTDGTEEVFDAGPTCNALEAKALAILDPLLAAATADLSCTTDDDCAFVEDGTACTPGCGILVTTANAPKITAARGQVDCTALLADGCADDFTYSCPRAAQGGVCVANQCTLGITAAWTSVALTRGNPAAGGNAPYTVWTVTPDGLVTVGGSSATETSAHLSAADFATVDGILRSASFRQAEGLGEPPTCTTDGGIASSATAGAASIDILRPSNSPEYSSDISACVAAGADSNDFETLYAVVQPYN